MGTSVADALIDDVEDRLGPRKQFRGSLLGVVPPMNIENTPVVSEHERSVCACYSHSLLECLSRASTGLVWAVCSWRVYR